MRYGYLAQARGRFCGRYTFVHICIECYTRKRYINKYAALRVRAGKQYNV